MERLRIDKWLWAARFYKTRTLASEEIDKGRVQVNGVAVKPAREVKPGDTLHLRIGVVSRTIVVRAITDKRGPAPVATLLFEEKQAPAHQATDVQSSKKTKSRRARAR
jgi:ribosome-associated heat shock protein Hsp15